MCNSNLSTEILNMVTGKLLGDGCITKQKGRKPRFQFIHSTIDKEWCFFCYEKLRKDLHFTPPYYKKVVDERIKKGYTECFQVQSRTDPLITWLECKWYNNRKKVIPFPFLEKYLNELALAWWYQDDGHLTRKENTPKKIILSTDNFTSAENRRLIGVLARKFHLLFKLDSQNRLILYDQLQIYYFLRLVEPYMHSSMKRKIIFPKHSTVSKNRTTIYLPSNIHLTKPTMEINQQLSFLNTLKDIVMDRTRYLEFFKKVIVPNTLTQETKGFQIIIHGKYNGNLQFIKNHTGLTNSQIITLCFRNNFLEI
ncbi:endonuclease [Neobacillus sp. MM2021_6]|uniref:endonuclease n=1 Tax=Bacillaceae TaxID=186817 RepID=UPI001408801D|nr:MULTISPECIES: endonuclease [Bacillaceae]MBO0961041.1 endonuclease [Neobacillus sp. MM2021_6]NHC21495.1 endonuclease [Bacillus sp. MM2020_4]